MEDATLEQQAFEAIKETAGNENVVCGWFAHCFNLAVTTVYHPILGYVPVCQSCKDFTDS